MLDELDEKGRLRVRAALIAVTFGLSRISCPAAIELDIAHSVSGSTSNLSRIYGIIQNTKVRWKSILPDPIG